MSEISLFFISNLFLSIQKGAMNAPPLVFNLLIR